MPLSFTLGLASGRCSASRAICYATATAIRASPSAVRFHSSFDIRFLRFRSTRANCSQSRVDKELRAKARWN